MSKKLENCIKEPMICQNCNDVLGHKHINFKHEIVDITINNRGSLKSSKNGIDTIQCDNCKCSIQVKITKK